MIAKKIRNPDHSATKAVRIRTLAAYIRAPESESSTEKCVYYGARGFVAETAKGHAAEMLALAEDAVRTRDPINHYTLSWREGEFPTSEQVEEAIDILLDEMQLAEHQVIYGLHADTDNVHLHVMLNRAYEDDKTGGVKVRKINRGYDIDSVHRVGARIESAQGWEVEANKRYRVLNDGTLERASREETEAAPGGPGQQQLDRERRTGEKSAVRSASELAAPIIAQARSWEELHTGLAKRGLRYERTARARTGAVVIIGAVTMKASRVSGEATLRKLESRLGPYRALDPSRDRPVEPKDAAPLIAVAKSWGELHASLDELGLRYEKVGSGARVVAGTLETRASVVSRDASLARLKKRLGPYEPPVPHSPDVEPPPRSVPPHFDPKAAAHLIAAARSWTELHCTLADHGLRYERFGSGARIVAGATIFKASTVARHASLGALQKRLGAYEPPPGALPRREPLALDPDMSQVNDFRAARAAYRTKRDAERRAFEARYEDDRKALRDNQAREREEVRSHDWQGRGAALAAIRKALAHKHAVERAERAEKKRRRRAEHRRRYPPWPSYEAWLRDQGRPDWADRWRHQRPAAIEGAGESRAVPYDIRGYEARIDGQRILYRRRGSPPGSPDAFRDVGRRVDVLDWRSEESTLAALELSAAKWGRFKVAGSAEFKALCVRLAAEHGFRITNPELQQNIPSERERLGDEMKAGVSHEPSPDLAPEPVDTTEDVGESPRQETPVRAVEEFKDEHKEVEETAKTTAAAGANRQASEPEHEAVPEPTAEEKREAIDYLQGRGSLGRRALHAEIDRMAREHLEGKSAWSQNDIERQLAPSLPSSFRLSEGNGAGLDTYSVGAVRSEESARVAAELLSRLLNELAAEQFGPNQTGPPPKPSLPPPDDTTFWPQWTPRGREKMRSDVEARHTKDRAARITSALAEWDKIGDTLAEQIQEKILPLEVAKWRERKRERTESKAARKSAELERGRTAKSHDQPLSRTTSQGRSGRGV